MFKGIYVVGLKTMKRAKWSEPDSSGKGGQERALLRASLSAFEPPTDLLAAGEFPLPTPGS